MRTDDLTRSDQRIVRGNGVDGLGFSIAQHTSIRDLFLTFKSLHFSYFLTQVTDWPLCFLRGRNINFTIIYMFFRIICWQISDALSSVGLTCTRRTSGALPRNLQGRKDFLQSP